MVLFSIARTFAVQMDSSINVVGMDVEYSVTKALEYTPNLEIKTALNNISFSHAPDDAGTYHNIQVDISANVSVADEINTTIAYGTVGWVDLSLNKTHITEAVSTANLDSTDWDKSVSDCLDHLVNAAFDNHLKTGDLDDTSALAYSDFELTDFGHAFGLAVNEAWKDSSDSIYSGAQSFGQLIENNLNDASGIIDVTATAEQHIISDVFKQVLNENINTLGDLDQSQLLGDLLNGNQIEFVLQVLGSGTNNVYEFENTSANSVVPTSGVGSVTQSNAVEGIASCVTKGAPSGIIGLTCNPAVFLLRYTVA